MARKIERAIFTIENGLYLMRRLRLGRIGERMNCGDHFDLPVALHFSRELIDQPWINQRLIALDVDDVGDAAQLRRDFGDAVRAAGVIRTR